MLIKNLSQALVSNGKASKYLDQQIEKRSGNIVNALQVIFSIESRKKHAFMKKSSKLKMFDPLEIYHHHVDWNTLDNASWYLSHNENFNNSVEQVKSGKLSPADAMQRTYPLILQSVGIGVINKTGQWLIYAKHNSINYFIGIFEHSNDSLTHLKKSFEEENWGLKLNIHLTDANNDNKVLSEDEQKVVIDSSKKYNDMLFKNQVLKIINDEFPEFLINIDSVNTGL